MHHPSQTPKYARANLAVERVEGEDILEDFCDISLQHTLQIIRMLAVLLPLSFLYFLSSPLLPLLLIYYDCHNNPPSPPPPSSSTQSIFYILYSIVLKALVQQQPRLLQLLHPQHLLPGQYVLLLLPESVHQSRGDAAHSCIKRV